MCILVRCYSCKFKLSQVSLKIVYLNICSFHKAIRKSSRYCAIVNIHKYTGLLTTNVNYIF